MCCTIYKAVIMPAWAQAVIYLFLFIINNLQHMPTIATLCQIQTDTKRHLPAQIEPVAIPILTIIIIINS
jgi:hypothetical protein